MTFEVVAKPPTSLSESYVVAREEVEFGPAIDGIVADLAAAVAELVETVDHVVIVEEVDLVRIGPEVDNNVILIVVRTIDELKDVAAQRGYEDVVTAISIKGIGEWRSRQYVDTACTFDYPIEVEHRRFSPDRILRLMHDGK